MTNFSDMLSKAKAMQEKMKEEIKLKRRSRGSVWRNLESYFSGDYMKLLKLLRLQRKKIKK